MTSPLPGICITCDHKSACAWNQHGCVIWECSDFLQDKRELQINGNYNPKASGMLFRKVRGLCGTCDLRQSCQWYREDAAIYQCEHYE